MLQCFLKFATRQQWQQSTQDILDIADASGVHAYGAITRRNTCPFYLDGAGLVSFAHVQGEEVSEGDLHQLFHCFDVTFLADDFHHAALRSVALVKNKCNDFIELFSSEQQQTCWRAGD